MKKFLIILWCAIVLVAFAFFSRVVLIDPDSASAYELIHENIYSFMRPETVSVKSGTYDEETNTLYVVTSADNKLGVTLVDPMIITEDGIITLDWRTELSEAEIEEVRDLARQNGLNTWAINFRLWWEFK